MTDYLTKLALRTLSPEAAIKPRLRSLYEPSRALEPGSSDAQPRWESVEATVSTEETSTEHSFEIAPRVRRPTTRQADTPTEMRLASTGAEKLDDSSPTAKLTQQQPTGAPVPRISDRRSPGTNLSAQLSTEDVNTSLEDRYGSSPSRQLLPEQTSVLSAQLSTPDQSTPTKNAPPPSHVRASQIETKVSSRSAETLADNTELRREEAGLRLNAPFDLPAAQSTKENAARQPPNLLTALPESKSHHVNRRVTVEQNIVLEQSQRSIGPMPVESSPPGRVTSTKAPAVIVQPHNTMLAHSTKAVVSKLPEPIQPEPAVQVTIGRIEIRASMDAAPRREGQRPAASKLMSLDDYLRQRADGGGK
jgi:hypothetical protein